MNIPTFRVLENDVSATNRKLLFAMLKRLIVFLILILNLAAVEKSASAQPVSVQRVRPPGGGLVILSLAQGDVQVRGNQWFVQVIVTNNGDADADPFQLRVTDNLTGLALRFLQVPGLLGTRDDRPSGPGVAFLECLLPKTGCKLDLTVEGIPSANKILLRI